MSLWLLVAGSGCRSYDEYEEQDTVRGVTIGRGNGTQEREGYTGAPQSTTFTA